MERHPSAAGSTGRDAAGQRLPAIGDERREFAEAARFYLQLEPRQLPSRFLYDTLGSALFDAICHLPWYRVTRGELRLLRRYGSTIGRLFRNGGRIVELGTHDELISRNGYYSDLYNKQLLEEELAEV